MELIIYLILTIAFFVGIFTFVAGLVSAPTSILVTILIVGLLITQKSINKLNESGVEGGKNKDQGKIENREVALNNMEKEAKTDKINESETMTYRGCTYNKTLKLEKNQYSHPETKAEIKYRGVSVSDHQKTSS